MDLPAGESMDLGLFCSAPAFSSLQVPGTGLQSLMSGPHGTHHHDHVEEDTQDTALPLSDVWRWVLPSPEEELDPAGLAPLTSSVPSSAPFPPLSSFLLEISCPHPNTKCLIR